MIGLSRAGNYVPGAAIRPVNLFTMFNDTRRRTGEEE